MSFIIRLPNALENCGCTGKPHASRALKHRMDVATTTDDEGKRKHCPKSGKNGMDMERTC